jgi:hypothetical protein
MEISSVNFIYILRSIPEQLRKMERLWQESNLRPCDSGQLLRFNRKSMYIYQGYASVIRYMGKYQYCRHISLDRATEGLIVARLQLLLVRYKMYKIHTRNLQLQTPFNILFYPVR